MEIKDKEMHNGNGTPPSVPNKKRKKKKAKNALLVENTEISGESLTKKLKVDPDIDFKEAAGNDNLRNSKVEHDAKENTSISPVKKKKRKRSRCRKKKSSKVSGEKCEGESEMPSSKETEMIEPAVDKELSGSDIHKSPKKKRKKSRARNQKKSDDKVNGEKCEGESEIPLSEETRKIEPAVDEEPSGSDVNESPKKKRKNGKDNSDKVNGENTMAESEMPSKETESEKSVGTDVIESVKKHGKRKRSPSRKRSADKINGEKSAKESEPVKAAVEDLGEPFSNDSDSIVVENLGEPSSNDSNNIAVENLGEPSSNNNNSIEKKRKKKKRKRSINQVDDNDECTKNSKSEQEVDVDIVNESHAGGDEEAAFKSKKKKNKKKREAVSQDGVKEREEPDSESESLKAQKTSQSATLMDEGVTVIGSKAKKKNQKKKKKKKSNPEAFSSSGNSMTTECPQECSESEVSMPSGAVEIKMNMRLSNKDFLKEITSAWKKGVLCEDTGFELVGNPFRACFISDFLEDSSFLNKVKDELSTLDYQPKSNDLYKFSQTSDLKSVKSPCISNLKKFLYGDFRMWLSKLTGIELSEKVDMGSSQYGYTDVLLCHDDELEGRRIAYILYLTPPWDENDGGTLDLFDNVHGEPRDIVKSFSPEWNSFAFFEVSPVSFHQVREVLSKDKVRLSINGWFHGPNIERPPKKRESPRPFLSAVHIDEEEFYQWVNPSYLDEKTQKQIRKKFQEESEIELEKFLNEEKYDMLCKAIKKSKAWVKRGPANKQSCKVLEEEQIPNIIQECKRLFQSEAMFLILSDLTGLKLHPLAQAHSDSESDEEEEEEKNSEHKSGVTIDVRKWSHGSYTLLRDCDVMEKKPSLDAMLFVRVPENWTLEQGGFVSYIAKDEDEELLTVIPHSNSLALIYRDLETLKFHKYINASVQNLENKKKCFYDVSCTYLE